MNMVPLITTTTITLIARTLFKPKGAKFTSSIIAGVVAILLESLFAIIPIINRDNWWIVIVIMMLFVVHIILLWTVPNGHLASTISFGTILLILIPTVGNPQVVPGYNALCISLALKVTSQNSLLSLVTPAVFRSAIVMLVGLWLAGVEMNHPIALILKQSKLMPSTVIVVSGGKSTRKPTGLKRARTDEPARGRMIGIFERMIVLVLTLTGNLSALGLVLAAKAFARFKDMDERDFAEYVLIGTLMSISAAILVGLLLKPLL